MTAAVSNEKAEPTLCDFSQRAAIGDQIAISNTIETSRSLSPNGGWNHEKTAP
jgi:hypothetical protein